MKVICTGLDLSEALVTVSRALNSKIINPILEGIKIEAISNTLTLSATDKEISIIKTIKADVIKNGVIVVPGKVFCEYIKSLNSNDIIELEENNNGTLLIKYGKAEGEIKLLNTDEYPFIMEEKDRVCAYLYQKELKTLINKTVYCTSVSDNRPILKAGFLEINEDIISSVSTDGYQLAFCEIKMEKSFEKEKFLIPQRSLSEVTKSLNEEDKIVTLYCGNKLMVDMGHTKIITNLIKSDYINYREMLKSEFNSVFYVERAKVLNALERASIITRNTRENVVSLEIKENNLKIKAKAEIGNVNEEVDIKLNGKDIDINFNCKFIYDGIKNIESEVIEFNIKNTSSACIIKPVDDKVKYKHLYLILPVHSRS